MATYLIGDVRCHSRRTDRLIKQQVEFTPDTDTPMADWRFGRPRSRPLDVLRYVKSRRERVKFGAGEPIATLAVFAGITQQP